VKKGERPATDGASPGSREDCGFVAPVALYVHVPICASRCSYCDFFSSTRDALPEGYERTLVDSTLRRAALLAERFGTDGFETVYIGGGTPTMLSGDALEDLLSGLANIAKGSRGRAPHEWTVEANPDSLDTDKLDRLAAYGVNRLSIGAQSLDKAELELLGRRHGPEAALEAVQAATARGMSVSADLIAGIPTRKATGRPVSETGKLSRFARLLVDVGASHISAYDLSIEEGTPLALQKRELDFPGEDELADERARLESELAGKGMRRYEVSNYSPIGRECLHNLAYWRMDSYIGAGPGAVSTVARRDGSSLRIEEMKSVAGYGESGSFSASEEVIGKREAAFETIMMAFRTSFGLDEAAFRSRFGIDAEALIGSTLRSWAHRILPGEPWPRNRMIAGAPGAAARSAGPALDGAGMDLLNRFLGDCLREIDRSFPGGNAIC
jgi:oxygen-independent coproporphyrinogen III oxidase